MPSPVTEYDTLLFLRDVIQTGINEAITAVGNGYTTSVNGLSGYPNDYILLLSRSSIYIDPDAEFVFSSEASSVVTYKPVIVIELENTRSTQTSNQGTRIYGEVSFSISVITTRVGRAYTVYKKEVADMVDMITKLFTKETGKRVAFEDTIAFSDFMLDDMKCSGAVIELKTAINNYEYTLS